MPAPRIREVSDFDRHIRRSWERQAAEAGLGPVAAFWRWRVLQAGRPVGWLKEPWGKERP